MPYLPAFCGHCGLAFKSDFEVRDITECGFIDCTCTCPRCRKMARIPSGIYNTFGETVELLLGPDSSVEQLIRLRLAIQTAMSRRDAAETVRKAVVETAPQLTSIASALPTNRAELYAFLSVLVAIVAMLISAYAAYKPSGPTKVEVESIVRSAFDQMSKPDMSKAQPLRSFKVGANDPCPCGSGKKYKKCCR